MFLLDSEVVVALRDVRSSSGETGLAAWAAATPRQSMFLSVQSMVEIEQAAARARKRSRDVGATWDRWIADQLLPAFEGRILPVDPQIARRAAQLGHEDMPEALVAATALQHSLTLATRRAAAFRAGRIRLLNPWQYSADVAAEGDWRDASRAGSLWFKNLFVRA
jgi:predicted nucleic acid-binding protein